MKLIKIIIKLLFLLVSFYTLFAFLIIDSSRKNNLALEKDVNKILSPHNVGNMDCKTASFGSRTGKCIFWASSKQINTLITEIKMEQYIAVDLDKVESIDDIPRLPTFDRLCEEIQSFKESSDVNIYQLDGENPRLLLKPGRFDYLILYYYQKSNKSCIQFRYSYG